MKVIPREARRVTYSTKIRKLKSVALTEIQKAVVIGSILGDGCLCENWSKTNYCLKISHSKLQKEYLLWKINILNPFVIAEPYVYGKTNSITIRTISHPELSLFQKEFYYKRVKIISPRINEFLLNPLVIAIWFMDDGNAIIRKGKLCGYHINSQSFSKEENLILSKHLLQLHGIESNLELNHGKFRIAIWRQDSRRKFRNLLEPYILESLRYKIG